MNEENKELREWIENINDGTIAFLLDYLSDDSNLYYYGREIDLWYIATDQDDDVYGTLPHRKNGYGDTFYHVNKENVVNGLLNALNGTFITSSNTPEQEKENAWYAVSHLYSDEVDGDSMFDADDASIIWQIICFNELIYG
jgi:hypothetical protein